LRPKKLALEFGGFSNGIRVLVRQLLQKFSYLIELVLDLYHGVHQGVHKFLSNKVIKTNKQINTPAMT
jgi:hypothetical protein